MALANNQNNSEPEVIDIEKKDGLLEELNLPPKMIKYIRANALNLQIVGAVVIVMILAWSYYDYHTQQKRNDASLALANAVKVQDKNSRLESLANVSRKFSGTGAAYWSLLEEGHVAFQEAHYDEAQAKYQQVYDELAADNPMRPLVIYALALAQENAGQLDQALVHYRQLEDDPGFKTTSLVAEGRVYELKGDPANALTAYRQVVEDQELSSQTRSLIKEKINTLQTAPAAVTG